MSSKRAKTTVYSSSGEFVSAANVGPSSNLKTRKRPVLNKGTQVKLVSISSSAFNYYANNDKARKAAADRFDQRVNAVSACDKAANTSNKLSRGA